MKNIKFFRKSIKKYKFYCEVREFLRMLSSILQTRSHLAEGLQILQEARAWDPTLARGLEKINRATRSGQSLSSALIWVSEDHDLETFLSQVFRLLASVLDSGFPIEPALQRLLERVERLCRLYQRSDVATAQIRLQALVITALPALCFVIVCLLSPQKMGVFLTTFVGKVGIASVVFMDLCAWFWMQAILKKVLPRD